MELNCLYLSYLSPNIQGIFCSHLKNPTNSDQPSNLLSETEIDFMPSFLPIVSSILFTHEWHVIPLISITASLNFEITGLLLKCFSLSEKENAKDFQTKKEDEKTKL